MPSLKDVGVGVVENEQCLNDRGRKVCWRCCGELPTPESNPSEDPTDDAVVLFGSQLGSPSILRGGSRGTVTEPGQRLTMFHSVDGAAYIEANSASDAQVQRVPMKQRMKPYTRATGPPFVSAVTKTTVKASLLCFSSLSSRASFESDGSYQVAMTVVVRLRILMNPKFRCRNVSILDHTKPFRKTQSLREKRRPFEGHDSDRNCCPA